jgi:hypothetical protein
MRRSLRIDCAGDAILAIAGRPRPAFELAADLYCSGRFFGTQALSWPDRRIDRFVAILGRQSE